LAKANWEDALSPLQQYALKFLQHIDPIIDANAIISAHKVGRGEGRGKREEGRGKREEGRGKREEGRGKREEGRGKREEGRGGERKDKIKNSPNTIF
jgi:hypothetical protein